MFEIVNPKHDKRMPMQCSTLHDYWVEMFDNGIQKPALQTQTQVNLSQ